MDAAVVDLTDSPPLTTDQARAFGTEGQPIVVSSDDENVRAPPSLSGVTALPSGYILPPIQRQQSVDFGRPERITTLRDVLSTRNSRQRGRSMLARQRAGLHMQPGFGTGSFVPHVLPHTGDEPVEPGVYYPIRARSMLPSQRQRQRQRERELERQEGAGGAESPALAGREMADGSIDVGEVEENSDADSGSSLVDGTELEDLVDGFDDDDDDNDDDYTSGSDDGAMGPAPIRPDGTTGQTIMDYLMMRREGQRMMADAHTGPALNTRARRLTFAMPPPDMAPPRMRMSTGGRPRFRPFDFFPGEDISNLLSFLEAATPAPPVRPMAPMPPLKMSKRQEELAGLPDYSRRVPRANYRDASEPVLPEALEIVCAQCTATLLDKEPAWAPTCGHVLCNTCVETFTSASRACAACKKRVLKKSLVHLFL
ncbi:hypothetical protein GGF46_002393 [Coemansia sp. RSA 552]|nr:hypothetical protein GGF46_002393 [Coemansia sp. RSA 552]